MLIEEPLTKDEAIAFALDHMKKHGLLEQGWVFALEYGNRTRLGACFYETKTLYLSEWVLTALPEEVKDTILHEIAHAIAGSEAEHGLKWKMIAKNVGAKPRDCFSKGIPQDANTRTKPDGDSERESTAPAGPPATKLPQTASYEIFLDFNGYEFVLSCGTHVLFSHGDFKTCLDYAITHCRGNSSQLTIPFQKFVSLTLS